MMLQGRLFSYSDTHRHRLGTNYLQIPVNCPYNARVKNYQRDGPQCVTDNQGKYMFMLYFNYKMNSPKLGQKKCRTWISNAIYYARILIDKRTNMDFSEIL